MDKKIILIIIGILIVIFFPTVKGQNIIDNFWDDTINFFPSCISNSEFLTCLDMYDVNNNSNYLGGHPPEYYLIAGEGYPGDVFINESGDIMTGYLNNSAAILSKDGFRAYIGSNWVNVTSSSGYINTSRNVHIGEYVGIGTSTPSVNLDVGANGADFRLGTKGGGESVIWVGTGGSGGSILSLGVPANFDDEIYTWNLSTTRYQLRLSTSGGTNGSTNHLVVRGDNGNVGINTITPTSDLYVLDEGSIGTPALTTNTIIAAHDGNNNANIAVISKNVGTASILFGDTDDVDRGVISYSHQATADDSFQWNVITGSAEMYLDKDGLHVGRTVKAPDFAFQVETDTGQAGYISSFFNDGNDDANWGIKVQAGADNDAGTIIFFGAHDGDNDLTGYLESAAGTFQLTDVSDERIKENITNSSSENVLDNFRRVLVRDYNFIDIPGVTHTGFVAQELVEIFPMAVSLHPERNYTVTEMRDISTGLEVEGNEISERSGKVLVEIVDGGLSKYLDTSNNRTYDTYMEWQDDNYEQFKKNMTDPEMYTTARTALIPHIVMAIQELIRINSEQDARIDTLVQELCSKDPTYSFCEKGGT